MPHAHRLLAELPPATRDVLVPLMSAATVEAFARDIATAVGRRLLVNDGECGWNTTMHALLRHDPSPAVRHIAGDLRCGGRKWSADKVTKALRSYFELHSAYDELYKRLRTSSGSWPELPTAQAA